MFSQLKWQGAHDTIGFDEDSVLRTLMALDHPCYVVLDANHIGFTNAGDLVAPTVSTGLKVLAFVPPSPESGDPDFRATYQTRSAYMAGAMANGISSARMVIALGQAGLLGSFGAAGLVPAKILEAIQQIQAALPNGPYAFNLIHSPLEEALEARAVDLYLEHQVRVVEASAYLGLTPHIVRYRVAGLALTQDNQIQINNRVIAKVSRSEVARLFMAPAPQAMLDDLLRQNLITEQQAALAAHVPMADDITVEADSAGHTDNRPLVVFFPEIVRLRDELQAHYQYAAPVRIGAAGGIGTPTAALAAFTMGAAYIVTGSVNQSCVESGASPHTRQLLAQADLTDTTMAPAADMFEMGVKLQVLKKGTMFPVRAQKLYDLYRSYNSLDEIPADALQKLEQQIFRQPISVVWQKTQDFFRERDASQIERANTDAKHKMALIFRWYLGLSSHWSNVGEQEREIDYQIWCGPAMGAFNQWVRGSYLEPANARHVVDVAGHILRGASYLNRVQLLQQQNILLPDAYRQCLLMPQ